MGALKNNLLVSVLRGDIERFLNTNTELMFNERDLQVRVATWLRDSGHYDKVDMEYAVPKEELEARGLELKTLSFPWNNDLSIDVVVERLGEFAAVELKYATRPVDVKIDRFGEPLKTNCLIVKEQAASDLIMYNYWKDVRRIEALALFLAIGGLIWSIFYGFFWVIKFSFMLIYNMLRYMALGVAYVVKRILDLPFGWAILLGLFIIMLLIQAISS